MDDAYLDGLVKMLRTRKTSKDGVTRQPRKHEREAADAIKQLRGGLAKAREALEPFAEEATKYDPEQEDGLEEAFLSHFTLYDLRKARKALETSNE